VQALKRERVLRGHLGVLRDKEQVLQQQALQLEEAQVTGQVMEVLQQSLRVNKAINQQDLEQMDELMLDLQENKEQAKQVNSMFAEETDAELLKELEALGVDAND